jgi:hypothetical protein
MGAMSGANPLPKAGEVFFDARGEDRALRISWHPDAQVMVISIWNRGVCSGTFRLSAADVPLFMESLSQGLPSTEPRGRRHADPPNRQQGHADAQDGHGPTTQALDALKSLSGQPPAPQPMHQTGAHYPHPQRHQPQQHPQQPPPPPQQAPPPPPQHGPPPRPAPPPPPPMPPQPPPSQGWQHGFPATGEYERRNQHPGNG